MKAQALKTIWKDKLRRLASGGRKAEFRLLFFIQHRDISGLNIKMTGIEIRQTFFPSFFILSSNLNYHSFQQGFI